MSYNRLFLDLDGTVYTSGKPIADVVNVLNTLKEKGINITFLTNNTSVSISSYLKKLNGMEIDVEISSIASPTLVAADFLGKKYHSGKAFILGTPDFIKEFEEKSGIKNSDDNPDFILVAFDKTLTYQKLERASELIHTGTPYYNTHIDMTCPYTPGPIPDCGLMVHMLEHTTGVSSKDHFGKPGDMMCEYLKAKIKQEDKALFAGDRLYTDMEFGKKIGVDTLLVFSGESTPEDLAKSHLEPTYTAETLAGFLKETYKL